MDHSDIVVDLESCRSTSGVAGSTNSPLDTIAGDVILTSVCNGDDEELPKAENGLNTNSNIKDDDDLTGGSVRVFIDKASLVEKKTSKEKCKSISAKKPPKPPMVLLANHIFAIDTTLCPLSSPFRMSYRSSAMSFDDSVQSGRVRENRFIIVQDNTNLSTSIAILAGSGSSDKVEQASCLTHGSSTKSITS